MQVHYETAEAFAADVAKEAKGAWINGTYDVCGKAVGIKAYGNWVQRIVVGVSPYDSGEFTSQKAMRAFIVSRITTSC